MHDKPRPPLYHCLIKSRKALFALGAVCFGLVQSGFSLAADGWVKTSAPGYIWRSVVSSADGSRLAAACYGAIYVSSDGGANWQQRPTPMISWSSITISADGTRLVATAYTDDSGRYAVIHTSADFGSTWTKTSAPIMSWNAIASSADGSQLVAPPYRDPDGNPQPLYISRDAGITWKETDTPAEHWVAAACTPDGKKITAVARITSSPWSSRIYTSSDSGVHWALNNEAAPAMDHIAISSDGVKVVGAFEGERGEFTGFTTPGFICTSADSGLNWTTFDKPGTWDSVASSADGRQLMATVTFGIFPAPTTGAIFTSSDSGATWKDEGLEQNYDWASIATSADGAKRVATASSRGIYTLSTLVSASSQFTNIVFYPGDSFSLDVTASGAGPISYQWQKNGTNLSDGGSLSGVNAATLSVTNATAADVGNYTVIVSNAANSVIISNAVVQLTDWTPLNFSLSNSAAFAASADGRTLLTGPLRGQVYVSSDYGKTWAPASLPESGWSSISCSADGNRLLAISYTTYSDDKRGCVYTSPDSGKHWQKTGLTPAYWISGASSADGEKLVASSEFGTYVSTDGGTNWIHRLDLMAKVACSADGTSICALPYVPGSSPIVFSTDSGVTWHTDGNAVAGSGFIASSADGKRWISASPADHHIYVSADGGNVWKATTAPLADWWQAASSASGTDLAAINLTTSGISTSADSGTTWQSTAAPTTRWLGIAITADGSTLYAAGQRGIWRSPVLPRLTIAPSLGGLSISWPMPSTNSVLQQSTGLAPSEWAPVEALPVEADHLRRLTISLPAKSTYFRLVQP
jgi:hypothetical protein